jgi:hypothetical protein
VTDCVSCGSVVIVTDCGPGNSFGIVTDYGLHCPRIELVRAD